MHISLLLVLLSLPTDLTSDANTLSVSEKKAGWMLLFDGRTTDGWRNYRKETIGDGWKVQDGALVRAQQGAGDIITKQQCDFFELSLEYKISPGGNSGLMFHVTEDAPRPWHSGPEVQIQDNVDGHDPQKSGWLYQLYPASEDATRPAGQWNEIRLRIAPDGGEIQMNGVRYSRFNLGNRDWNNKVAASKFSEFAQFGKAGKGHLCLQDHGNLVSFRNIKIRELSAGGEPVNPIDGILPIKVVPAFSNVTWTGWSPEIGGRPQPLRPIILTHAGDGSNRVFMATQQGVIHVFDHHDRPQDSRVFLDLRANVIYKDRENEEGLLGVAFHPDYARNGHVFLYHTTSDAPHTSVITRYTVMADDPDRADSESATEILRIPQPFWNHNGGTIAFGPDGFLYVGLGDGGAANDPYGNGQNLQTLLGSILRIDVDRTSENLAYAIPQDNPFVDRSDARPEIWAYGLRNVWRLAFDRQDGSLWAGEVGQNLWEEINIIRRVGNYGWNLREAAHPFGPHGSEARDDLIEPIWEYDHEVGKSITGGHVYRGERLPELQGSYLYADYVSGHIWALAYDRAAGRVVWNKKIPSDPQQVISFGEDESGEVYFTVVSPTGRGIFTFASE